MERHVLHGRLQVVQVVLVEWLQTQPISKGPPKPTHTNSQTSRTLGKRQSYKKVLGGTEGLDEGTPARPCEDWKIQCGNTHTKEPTPTHYWVCQHS